MLKEFENLTAAETALMFDALPLITILVAGADDDIDEVEVNAAENLAEVRSFNNYGQLTAYYESIDHRMAGRVDELIRTMPAALEDRQQYLSDQLSELNPILAKLKEPFGYLYYKTFKTFAEHVAKAHGGFLRFLTVSYREAEVMELPMITPIRRPEEKDDTLL